MSDDMDIRQWAKANGHDVNTRGPVTTAVRAKFEEAHGGDTPSTGEVVAVSEDGGAVDTTQAAAPPSRERQPVPPPGSGGRPMSAGEKRAAAAAGKPTHRRVSVEKLVSSAWSAAAGFLGRQDRALPIARVLRLQAPVAGAVVERMARDTLVDRILQPLARINQRGENLSALIGPPLLVAAITAQPGLYDMLAPMLMQTLMSWMEIAGPELEKARKRAEKLEDEFGADVKSLVEMIFAPPVDADAEGNGVG